MLPRHKQLRPGAPKLPISSRLGGVVAQPAAPAGDVEKQHVGVAAGPLPLSVLRILGTEFGERFSYYSLRAVLTLYFLSLGFSESEAVSTFAFTSALAYLTPLFGGVIADVWWGRYRTILVFSLLYVVGSFGLSLDAASGGSPTGALAALALISIGTGGIKPCVSSFGADQLPEEDEAGRSRYFASFYLAINFGSIFSFIVAPVLRNTLGFSAAFGAAAVVLSAAVAVFASGRSGYRQPPPAGSFYRDAAAYLTRRAALVLRGGPYSQLQEERAEAEVIGTSADARKDAVEARGGKTSPEDARVEAALSALQRLMPPLLLMPCFWALFEQQGSAWVLQAKAMRRDGLLPFGWEVSPEMLQIFNPIFVLVLVPAMTKLFESWPRLFGGRRAPAPTQKMSLGMVVASFAFLCSAVVQQQVDVLGGGAVPVLWQLPQIFLITLAEVLVSVVSLDYFYSQAPAEAKAAVSALQLLTVSVGAVLYGLLYKVLSPFLGPSQMLLAFSVLMALNAAVFFSVTQRIRPAAATGMER